MFITADNLTTAYPFEHGWRERSRPYKLNGGLTMNTRIEMNAALSDQALDGVVGGSIFGRIEGALFNTNPFVVAYAPMVAPWGVAARAVASVVSHFKFW